MMGVLTKYERCPEATDLEIYHHSMSIEAIIYYGEDYIRFATAMALNAILVTRDRALSRVTVDHCSPNIPHARVKCMNPD